MMICWSKLMEASQKRWVMCASSGLEREDGSRARRLVDAAVILIVYQRDDIVSRLCQRGVLVLPMNAFAFVLNCIAKHTSSSR